MFNYAALQHIYFSSKRCKKFNYSKRPGRTPPLCLRRLLTTSLVADPSTCLLEINLSSSSIQVPGFDLPRRLWCTLNRFRTGQGRCGASLTRWQQITDPTCCDCGAPQQRMMHIVEDCQVTRFPSGLPSLHLANENALIWLDKQSKR